MFKTADKDNDNLVTGTSSYGNLVNYDRSYNISNNNKLIAPLVNKKTYIIVINQLHELLKIIRVLTSRNNLIEG
jgi:hypothetical protein